MPQSLLDKRPGISFLTNIDAIIMQTNREARRFFGEGVGLGQPLSDIVHLADREGFTAVCQCLPEDGEALRGVPKILQNGQRQDSIDGIVC